MKIKHVEASYLPAVPVNPLPFLKEPTHASVTIVAIETDSGLTGYRVTGSPLNWSVVEFINRQAAGLLKDQDPFLTERIWQQMFRKFNSRALTGVWSSAMSAVDIGLWDIKGKAMGLPVWRLLGGA